MRSLILSAVCGLFAAGAVCASTIMVVPVYEPLSLHGTDGDDVISEIGDALQATVLARPMALTGAFPEDLARAVRSPHIIPTNNPNYRVQEANLLVLCDIGIDAALKDGGLEVRLDVSKMVVPEAVDLTPRQIVKLAIVAIRKTLDEYQKPQTHPLQVTVVIQGAGEGHAALADLNGSFAVGPVEPAN